LEKFYNDKHQSPVLLTSFLLAASLGMKRYVKSCVIHKLEGTFVVNPAIKSPAELRGKTVGVTSLKKNEGVKSFVDNYTGVLLSI